MKGKITFYLEVEWLAPYSKDWIFGGFIPLEDKTEALKRVKELRERHPHTRYRINLYGGVSLFTFDSLSEIDEFCDLLRGE